jgi:carotenoid cleavage dioxygenase-like enzyme
MEPEKGCDDIPPSPLLRLEDGSNLVILADQALVHSYHGDGVIHGVGFGHGL